MHFSTSTTALAAAALALSSAQSVSAQGSAAPSSASSSSAPSRTSSTNTTASSAPNPLIPSTISPKCEAFLTYLNSHQDISTCTAPLLSALSTFQASAASNDYAANDAAVQDALAGLCYSAPCDDSLVRSLLTQFNSNCTAELTASNDVVLGSYDALYVLTPLRDAVCSTDSTADWCINDIAKGSMPAGSTGANATHVVSSVASSYAAAATASIDAGSPASASSSSASSATNETEATFNTTTHLVQSVPVVNNARILAAQDASFEIDVPAPPSLYVQITGAVKRLARRQWNGDSSASAWSSASASASRSGSSAQASASASSSGANSTAAASNSTSASTSSLGDDSTAAGVQSFDVPSILPNAATWSSASLPFLFLSPSMSSTVLCSQCTKSILSAYVAWESRMPYALGLANSPLLKGQGSLWTATGEKCGGGFLESVTKQAGETNLTGGAAQGLAVRASGVLGAAVLAATLLLA
ncbi:hypothetical protein JCM3775_007192 [Rhodotorula graminis]